MAVELKKLIEIVEFYILWQCRRAMRRIIAVCLIIIFFTTQYGYSQTSCYECTEPYKISNSFRFTNLEQEELADMFDNLFLTEESNSVNLAETYKVEYGPFEFTYVPLCKGNIYLFVKKDGDLLGAINQYKDKRSLLLPQNIQPELICVMVCFFIWGKSSFSIIACPLVPLATILYPSDQELRNALFKTCLNGILGIEFSLIYAYGFCN